MTKEDEIFLNYVLKRLQKDASLEYRDTLDPAEFNLASSESLSYLADVAKVKIEQASPKWITESEASDDEFDYYKCEPERVYVITAEDIVQKRAENIKKITAGLSPELTEKIQFFEDETKYLCTPALSSKRDISVHLQRTLPLFDASDNTNSKIRILIDKRIYDLGAIPLEQKEYRQVKKELKKDKEQEQFYKLLADVHRPKPKMEQIALYINLWNFANTQNPEDVRGFIKGDSYEMTSSLKGRIHKELKRDIAEKIHALYASELRNEAGWWQQELDALNQSLARTRSGERLLGPKGAFAKDGLYGPNSKFTKQEQVIEPSLFSDKDFEY